MTSAEEKYSQLKDDWLRMKELGEGSFGKVYLAERKDHQPHGIDHANNQNVNIANINSHKYNQEMSKESQAQSAARYCAAKKLKPYIRKKASVGGPIKIEQYPEVVVMKSLDHPNVMKIHSILEEDKGFEKAHYLMLDLGVPLMELVRHKEILITHEQIRWVIYQIVEGIDHIHSRGFMHRDIKPTNIYMMRDGTVKVGDFSISRPKKSGHAEEEEKTGNVTTRFYRAPEIMYGSKHYDESIDIWGLGCTLAELVLHQTIFPGSSDIHQLQLIFSIVGYPQQLWPDAENLPYYLEFKDDTPASGLKNLLPNIPQELLDFIWRCLTLDPKKRPTCKQLLSHSLLKDLNSIARGQLSKSCAYLYQKNLKYYM